LDIVGSPYSFSFLWPERKTQQELITQQKKIIIHNEANYRSFEKNSKLEEILLEKFFFPLLLFQLVMKKKTRKKTMKMLTLEQRFICTHSVV
jgi:hypothetical protein